jgi:hypothetical protein
MRLLSRSFRRARAPLLAAATALTLAACGPYLESKTQEAHRYTSGVRCAQGPYEFVGKMSGARWGEQIKLVQVSGAPLTGTFEVWVDGHRTTQGPIYVPARTTPTPATAGPPPKPPEEACKLSDADRAAGGGAPGTGTGTGTGSGDPGTGTGTPTVTVSTPKLVEIPLDGNTGWQYGSVITGWGTRVEHGTDAEFPYKAGTEIKIVFWSDKLLDLAGLELAFVHEIYVPSCGDEKWAARLAKEKAESDADAKAQQAESDRCRELAMKNALDDACRKKGWHDVADSERIRTKCSDLVAKNAVDAECEARGYENASRTAERARCQDLQKKNQTDEACHKIGYWNEQDSKPKGPDGPPPPPRAEERPPQPSEHAEWVPGSWEWGVAVEGKGSWQWVVGGWKVPDVDREKKATPTAPSQPPPPQVETPGAPPVTGLVWVAGYWHFSAGKWIWVPGRWARPPKTGATWRPNVWVKEGATIRLDPGQWILGK